jgi:exosortase
MSATATQTTPAAVPKLTSLNGRILPVAVGMLVLWLYWDVLRLLIRDWINDPNFSHGFFVPAFSLFLLWTNRDKLRSVPVNRSWAGVPVVVGALGLLIVGTLGAELFLSRMSLVFLLPGLVLVFWGWQALRAMAFPLAFLVFMVPIPSIILNQITLPLQFLASKLASGALPLIGVPVLREGNVIQLPAMSLEVAEACSGIRSLMSLIVLAIIYSYLLEPRLWRRVALTLAAVPIAVIANASRIVGTGACVQYWDPDKAEGFFHSFSGWLIFVVSTVLLVAVHKILSMVGRREAHERP